MYLLKLKKINDQIVTVTYTNLCNASKLNIV